MALNRLDEIRLLKKDGALVRAEVDYQATISGVRHDFLAVVPASSLAGDESMGNIKAKADALAQAWYAKMQAAQAEPTVERNGGNAGTLAAFVFLLLGAANARAAVFGFAESEGKRYLRLASPAHLEQSAGVLINYHAPANSAGVTDFAVLTHANKDDSLMPEACRATWCPPVAFDLFHVGFGGDFKGDAIGDLGFGFNAAPQLTAWAFQSVDRGSPAWLQATKDAFLGVGPGKVRIGYALQGDLVRGGVFQSAKHAFPGAGLFDILDRAGRVEVGVGWQY